MTFISQVTDHLLNHHFEHLGDCTVVFPNRRAGLFLKKEISNRIQKPVWSPSVLSLEDFLFGFSETVKTDTLSLVFGLYEAYSKHQKKNEGFEAFYFWGEMLLRDFEEVDHYLVNPEQLFHHIKSDRQLAEDFYFLDPDQEQIIRRFWQDFLPTTTRTQEQFVETWKILAPVYADFKAKLKEQQVGYTSSIYRELWEDMGAGQKPDVKSLLVFAGFNALTPVEELLIRHFVENGASILWDLDAYYLEDAEQEAGSFLRKYRDDPVLGKTFPSEMPSRIREEKSIIATGVSLEVGQAKWVGEQVGKLLAERVKPEQIVVVLPQEYMLFPVLNALPGSLEKLNVTMGYPLKETPLYGLLEASLEVQEYAQVASDLSRSYYHKPTLDVLSHPYIFKKGKKEIDDLIRFIQDKNQIRVPEEKLNALSIDELNAIFRPLNEDENLATYLSNIVTALGAQVQERFGLEKEYLYHFQQLLARLEEILNLQTVTVELKTFKSLFKKAARSVRIPFNGEPVEGLQVMGVLETRNLDFKHVFMVNMNEDIFPASRRSGSFMPYHIRRAFDLPTFEVQDAIYAYLFYRLLHHSEQVEFLYNMYADFGLSGELSRFVQQLDLERGPVKKRKLTSQIQVRGSREISINKSSEILEQLVFQYAGDGNSRLSASALNTYYRCKLQFYFRYVLRKFSENQLNDELDPREFGNVLHGTMEILYRDVIKNSPDRWVQETDFFQLKSSVDGAIIKAFKGHFNIDEKRKFELTGRNVMIAEIIKKYVLRILDIDEQYAPFQIVSMEKDDKYLHTLPVEVDGKPVEIRMGADIDRVDKKEGTVRVIDYKSGRDTREIESIEKLFDPTPAAQYQRERNKAGFQTMFYAWLYMSKYGSEDAIVPGLIGIRELFQEDFDFRLTLKNRVMEDSRPYLKEFEGRFTELVQEVFSMDQPFTQTEQVKNCAFCDFRQICGR